MSKFKQMVLGLVIGLVVGVSTVAAQGEPLPTFSSDVLATQAALEATADTPLPTQAETLVNDAPPLTPVVEVTEEADGGVNVSVEVHNPTTPEPQPEPTPQIDWVGRTMSGAAIIGVLVGLFLFWRSGKTIPETIDEANKRLTSDTALQTSLRDLFQQQNAAVQDGILKGLAFGALFTSWTPIQGDELLARNVNAILTGQPVIPPVTEPIIAQPVTPLNTANGQWVFVANPPAGPQAPSAAAADATTVGTGAASRVDAGYDPNTEAAG